MSEEPKTAPSDGSENPEGTGENPRDRALTLRPERLAGSTRCLNCGTPLKGPFCYYCGQPDRNFMRFFPALLREFFEEFMDLDSRFMRTMKPLLFRPGRLTRDYLEGRRFRYTPPLRLYLFTSIGFFLLASLLSSSAMELRLGWQVDGDGFDAPAAAVEAPAGLSPEDEAELRAAMERAGIRNTDELLARYREGMTAAGSAATTDGTFTADQITVGGKPWDRENNPVELAFMPDFVNHWINEEIAASPAKARRLNENPDLIVEQIFDILPATMFVLLPAVALLLKLWYLFAGRYYVEHLIYALHNHAFIFVSLILILLLNVLETTALAQRQAWVAEMTDWLLIIVSVWIPLYLLLSLRHVYRQSWLMTVGKFVVIGFSYLTLLGLVTGFVAVLGFLLI